MNISFNWLKTYIKTSKSVEDVAEILTHTGLEVEHIQKIESIKGGLKGLVVGQVMECVDHPNADKLFLTQIDIGLDQWLSIVCGAPNVHKGQKVVVAPIGTILSAAERPFKIKKTKIRGEYSYGMLCAEDEIGLGDSHQGIISLPETAQIGMPVRDLFKIEDDFRLEIGLTPNRSDGMSHIGVARDLSAALRITESVNLPLKKPDVSSFPSFGKKCPIHIDIQVPKLCPRYAGVLIEDIQVSPSPEWLQNRLLSIGISPVNNIVDITNFVLHEYGQPLHAFDADKIKGNKIEIKKLTQTNAFETLDGSRKDILTDDIMICNASEPICIAGIYGGLSSGVSLKTKRVFLESALFDPTTIRKTATRLGLKTDASTRFEKGVDPNTTVEALKRAALLIREIAQGNIQTDLVDIYPNPISPFKIDLTYEKIHTLIGIEIPQKQIHQILETLDIVVSTFDEKKMTLLVPAYRHDVRRDVDVIEEILRIYGFNRIPFPKQLRSSLSFTKGITPQKSYNAFANYLSSIGFYEVQTNSISQSVYYPPQEASALVRLLNSQTQELDVLRQLLLYGMLEVIGYNYNRGQKNIRIYEFGHVYTFQNDTYIQKKVLSIALSGQHIENTWLEKGKKQDFFHLKSIVESVLKKGGIKRWKLSQKIKEKSPKWVYSLGNTPIATIYPVPKNIRNTLGIKQTVWYGEINWEETEKQIQTHYIQYVPISKYPTVKRDLSLIINEETLFEQIEQIAYREGKNILSHLDLISIYRDEKIGAGKKSYAISLVLSHPNKTLTEKDIDTFMLRLIKVYTEELYAVIRK